MLENRTNAEPIIEFIVFGEIPSLKNTLRARINRGGRPIFFHKDNEVINYKQNFISQIYPKYSLNLTEKLAVELKIYKPNNRKDGCNLSDMVYDAMQFSGVIKNDRNIIERHEFDFIDKLKPRVEVKVWEVKSK